MDARRPPTGWLAAGLAVLAIGGLVAFLVAGRPPSVDVVTDAGPGAASTPPVDLAASARPGPPDVAEADDLVRVEGRVTTLAGAPAARARVRVVAFATGLTGATLVADDAGHFAFDGARGALYQAYVAPADAPADETLFPAEAVAGEASIVASLRAPDLSEAARARPPAGTASRRRPPEPSAPSIEGVVRDTAAAPVADAQVTARASPLLRGPPTDGERRSFAGFDATDADGRFEIPLSLSAGAAVDLTVTVHHAGGAATAALTTRVGARDVLVVVDLGTTTTVRSVEAAGREAWVNVTLRGRATTFDGDDRAGRTDDVRRTWASSARFDADGLLRVRGLPADATATVYVPPTPSDERVGWLEAVRTGSHTPLTLVAGRTVTGRFVGLPSPADGRPARVEVEARMVGFDLPPLPAVVEGDHYVVRGLPDGMRCELSARVLRRGAGPTVWLDAHAAAVLAGSTVDLTFEPR